MHPTPSAAAQAAADPRWQEAADLLLQHWQRGAHCAGLPAACRPADRAEGYAVQRELVRQIAATSEAGQRHIAVSGPLAGPVLAHRVVNDGATVSLAANRMRVAECEIVFRFGQALAPRATPWTLDEVLATVSSLHTGLEVPDDCACCCDMVLGAPVVPDAARLQALPTLRVQARVSDGRTPEGVGSNVLGDPVAALVWFVNEIGAAGQAVEAGQFVTTGACVTPIPVTPGLRVEADFGWLGRIAARFT